MKRPSLKNLAVAALLLSLSLTACGDVTVNGDWPTVDYSNAWWWSSPGDVIVTRTLTCEEPTEGLERLRLDAQNGSVLIVGQQGTGTVQVTADLLAGADTWMEAQAGLDLLEITVSKGPDEILVQTDQPGPGDGRHYAVHYTIHAPPEMEIIVTQTNGPITVEGVENQVQIAAVNGSVVLTAVSGGVLVNLSNGPIDTTAVLPAGGEIVLSTGNGDIDLAVPASTSATVSAHSGNGAIDWYTLPLAGVSLTDHTLDGTLGDCDGAIDLETGNGAIRIRGY